MNRENNCQCVVCQVEQSLLDSLSTQTARTHFQALAANHPVLNHFDSPADVIARLHEHERVEAANHKAWDGILHALVESLVDRTTEDIGQQLLLVAYAPTIHKVYREVCQEFNLFVLPDGSGVIARRGQGQFPNYENVLPKTPLEARVVFQREELLEGLTKLSPTARKGTNPAVKLELSKSPVSMKTENDGTANRVALEHTRISGKARDIGLNHNYLTQYVKSLETDTVSMKLFPRAISEVVVFDTFRYQHLLMPMRD